MSAAEDLAADEDFGDSAGELLNLGAFQQQHQQIMRRLTIDKKLSEQARFENRCLQIRAWIEGRLGAVFDPNPATDLMSQLKEGDILCHLVNSLRSGTIPTVINSDSQTLSFLRRYENVRAFLNGCKTLGLPSKFLFAWNDLIRNENLQRVLDCLVALMRHADPEAAAKESVQQEELVAEPDSEFNVDGIVGEVPVSATAAMAAVVGKTAAPLTPFHGRTHSKSLSDELKADYVRYLEYMCGSLKEQLTTQAHAPSAPTTPGLAYRTLGGAVTTPAAAPVVRARRPIHFTPLVKATAHQPAEDEDEDEQEAVDSQMEDDGSAEASSAQTASPAAGRTSAAVQDPAKVQQLASGIRELGQGCRSLRSDMSGLMSSWGEALKSANDQIVGRIEQLRARHREELETSHAQLKREEALRKQYLNELVDLKGSIRVFCRARPLHASEGEESSLQFNALADTTVSVVEAEGSLRTFEFDHVFPPASAQSQVYKEVSPYVHSAIDGYNVCVMAYGQTGSGKTFTMEGPREMPGVNSRALAEVFEVVNSREASTSWRYQVSLSVVEIYNEQAVDLLVPPAEFDRNLNSLQIRQDSVNGIHVPGLNEFEVRSPDEVLGLIEDRAKRNRATAATSMNEHSSRSHLLVFLNIRATDQTNHQETSGRLVLVDLAGSERLKRSGAEGSRMKEAQNINRSLSALGDVIAALKQKRGHVPYRNSKLTYLLQDCLGGHSKCLLFCNINPAMSSVGETLCSLGFASRVRSVTLGAASRRSSSRPAAAPTPARAGSAAAAPEASSQKLAELRNENRKLAAELQARDAQIQKLRQQLAAGGSGASSSSSSSYLQRGQRSRSVSRPRVESWSGRSNPAPQTPRGGHRAGSSSSSSSSSSRLQAGSSATPSWRSSRELGTRSAVLPSRHMSRIPEHHRQRQQPQQERPSHHRQASQPQRLPVSQTPSARRGWQTPSAAAGASSRAQLLQARTPARASPKRRFHEVDARGPAPEQPAPAKRLRSNSVSLPAGSSGGVLRSSSVNRHAGASAAASSFTPKAKVSAGVSRDLLRAAQTPKSVSVSVSVSQRTPKTPRVVRRIFNNENDCPAAGGNVADF